MQTSTTKSEGGNSGNFARAEKRPGGLEVWELGSGESKGVCIK